MKKRLSSQNAPDDGAESQSPPKTDAAASAAKNPPEDGSAGTEKAVTAGGTKVVHDVIDLDPKEKNLVTKLLKEGSTFEDVVEAVNARGGKCITLNAVKTYFQGNRMLQIQRARRQIEDAESLLASVDKDPKSAEARLARATFLTGYSRVHRDVSLVSPRDAARYRMECENLTLKHQILMMQKKKALQDLDYSRARTRLILLTQGKLQEEILKLQREVKAHRTGDPIGPEMLQRIQQLYGLACQPLLYEESVNAAEKA
jgi:hypothetical protein